MFLKRFTWKCRLCSVLAIPHRLKHNWVPPEGYDTGIRVYNIYLKQTVPLVFPNKNLVKWYICGPTVYDNSHIGHASCYVRFDIIRRILIEYFNIRPLVALGITDVAEDIHKKSLKTKEPCEEIARRYEKEFFEQMAALNVIPPHFRLRVSEYMPQVINFVKRLVDKNVAYKIDSGVYYDVSSDDSYGRFFTPTSDPNVKPKLGKKNVFDFALWKTEKDGHVWESPWGRGIPGWHIECSAMAGHIFGQKLDLHSGGIDLLFPHHENEEAQSCAYHGCEQWVNYWLHSGLLNIKGEKMSKSLSNFITISEYLDGRSSDNLRMICFMTHYRKNLSFEDDYLELSRNCYEKILALLSACQSYLRGSWTMGRVEEAELLQEVERTKNLMRDCFADDFNTATAFKHFMSLVSTATRMLNETQDRVEGRSLTTVATVYDFVLHFLKSVGFTLGDVVASENTKTESKLESLVDLVVKFRTDVRAAARSSSDKDSKKVILQRCDALRDDLSANGVIVRDRKEAQSDWVFGTPVVKDKPDDSKKPEVKEALGV